MRLFRSICMSLVVLVFSIVFIHPVTAQEPINTMWPWEIVDGGFEQWVQTSSGVWTLIHWGIAWSYDDGIGGQKITPSQDRVEGAFSAQMAVNTNQGAYSQINSGNLIEFEAGVYRITLSEKVLGAHVDGYVGMRKYVYDIYHKTWNETQTFWFRKDFEYTSDWKKVYSNFFTIDRYDPNTRYMLLFYLNSGSDPILIDDVKIERMTPISIPITCQNKNKGDADCDGVITQKDYEIWREEFVAQPKFIQSDFDGDGRISIIDFEIWRRNFFKDK